MRKMIFGTLVLAALAGGTGLLLLDRPATAQSFSTAPITAASASAGNGATDMWAIDPRTNYVIYCRGAGAKPVCHTVLVPGYTQTIDKLPR